MRQTLLAVGLAFAASASLFLQSADACPYCRVAAGGVAENSEVIPDDQGLPFKFSGAMDVASAYYFRGYLQADRGLILQESANLFRVVPVQEDLVVRPYVSLFNSSHFRGGNPMSGMFDAMAGATTTWRGLIVDSRYAYYNANPTMYSIVHELGSRASFDVLSLRQDSPLPGLSLRPFAGVYTELHDEKGPESVYYDVGFEPGLRIPVGTQQLGLALPVDWGLGSKGYYLDGAGGNATRGYTSVALNASLSLPVPPKYGQWFLNASAQYLHLSAENLTVLNGGDAAFAGKVGLALVY